MTQAATYKSAGVDIALKERLIPSIRALAKAAPGAKVIGGIGGFGALVALDAARTMRAPVLVSGTDGVGTKLKIAFATGRHGTVGIDCVAMCVNDIICHGAKPLFFLDYLATSKLAAIPALDIVRGVARGCTLGGLSLAGGETAQLPGLYNPGEYDLAGFAVGIVERAKIPDPRSIRPDDALVGIASNGLHSNGFSLARRALLERGKLKLNARIGELRCTLADELLRPTIIYSRIATKLFARFHIKGLANITGGGVPENVPRVLPDGMGATIRRGSWPVPPIFDLIMKAGRIARAEMDRTFNNGLGMVAIVAARDADRVVGYLRANRHAAYVVGEVRRGKREAVFA
ncbi:MAG: phosphoribosylformylglycinamidine cyclo-ligase [Candidatus Binataceae bacterium]